MSLTVATPATDRDLVSALDVQTFLGGTSEIDARSAQRLASWSSGLIADACRVPVGKNGVPRTLRAETLEERLDVKRCPEVLVLSRYPVIEIASVIENDETLTAADYLELGGGVLQRRSNGCPGWWLNGETVVTFTAGYQTVPDTLKYITLELARELHAAAGREPGVRSWETPDLGSETYKDRDTSGSLVPRYILRSLADGGYLYPPAI